MQSPHFGRSSVQGFQLAWNRMRSRVWSHLGLVFLGFGFSVSGFSMYEDPTQWTIINGSLQSFYVQCESEVPHGLQEPIRFSLEDPVAPGQSVAFVWDGWSNDGLGLNPAHWTCAVGKTPHPLTQGSFPQVRFSTNWGENMRLWIDWKSGSSSELTIRVESQG
ncbi:MAG: hypothetical protein ACO3A2_10450 [Bdellovibrionia bacterium]